MDQGADNPLHPDGDLAAFLVRSVLDPAFRDLVKQSPQEAFQGFDLSADEQATVRRGDAGMLQLLAAASSASRAGSDAGGGTSSVAPPPPADGSAAPGTAPDFASVRRAAAAPPAAPVTALPPITLQLKIQPWAQQSPEGLRLSFTSTIEHAGAQDPGAQPAGEQAASADSAAPQAWSAWDHDLTSDQAIRAASAARAAEPQDRRHHILELMRVMCAQEQIGGDDVERPHAE